MVLGSNVCKFDTSDDGDGDGGCLCPNIAECHSPADGPEQVCCGWGKI